jgi:hypothetical protein
MTNELDSWITGGQLFPTTPKPNIPSHIKQQQDDDMSTTHRCVINITGTSQMFLDRWPYTFIMERIPSTMVDNWWTTKITWGTYMPRTENGIPGPKALFHWAKCHEHNAAMHNYKAGIVELQGEPEQIDNWLTPIIPPAMDRHIKSCMQHHFNTFFEMLWVQMQGRGLVPYAHGMNAGPNKTRLQFHHNVATSSMTYIPEGVVGYGVWYNDVLFEF